MPIDEGPWYMPTARVAVQRMEDELILLDLETGEFLVARGLGAIVWDRLGNGHSVLSIAEEVARRYDRDLREVRSDIESFVGSLLDREFLTPREDG